MFEEPKTAILVREQSLSLDTMSFWIFLGVVSLPLGVFRGLPRDFLEYVDIQPTAANQEKFFVCLKVLQEHNYIKFDIDLDYVIIYVKRAVEKENIVDVNIIRRCRYLAQVNNKKNKNSWILLFKTWLGLEMLSNQEYFTMDELAELTGLSYYQLRENRKILEKDEVFLEERVGSNMRRIGTKVTMNAFLNDIKNE